MTEEPGQRRVEVFVAESTWRCPTCGREDRVETLRRSPIPRPSLGTGSLHICCDRHPDALCELVDFR